LVLAIEFPHLLKGAVLKALLAVDPPVHIGLEETCGKLSPYSVRKSLTHRFPLLVWVFHFSLVLIKQTAIININLVSSS